MVDLTLKILVKIGSWNFVVVVPGMFFVPVFVQQKSWNRV